MVVGFRINGSKKKIWVWKIFIVNDWKWYKNIFQDNIETTFSHDNSKYKIKKFVQNVKFLMRVTFN